MARVNVYLSNELHARAKRARLNVSELCQVAIHSELRRRERLRALDEYIEELDEALGPATAEETASAKAWAKGVVAAAERARARVAAPRSRGRGPKSA